MAIKNYTTQVPASRSIEEIQTALIKHGAVGVFYEYEPGGGGRVAALKFLLLINEKKIGFSLPVEWLPHPGLEMDTLRLAEKWEQAGVPQG